MKDKSIVSTGYNGVPKYQKNCLQIGFCYRDKHKIPSGTRLETCRAVGSHAESNAVALAARNGHQTNDSTIYVTGHTMICNQCKALIANAGITRSYWKHRMVKSKNFFRFEIGLFIQWIWIRWNSKTRKKIIKN